jgi:hypothetical protein
VKIFFLHIISVVFFEKEKPKVVTKINSTEQIFFLRVTLVVFFSKGRTERCWKENTVNAKIRGCVFFLLSNQVVFFWKTKLKVQKG